MAKVYKRKDIAENDIFGGIGESADKNLQKIEAVDIAIVKVSNHYKQLLAVTNTQTIEGITQLKAISEGLNKQRVVTIDLEKQKAIQERQNQKDRLDQIRLDKAREKNIDDYNKKLAKQTSAYQRLSTELNDLRNRYKDLASEEKHQTVEGKKMLDQITKLDTKLKHIDATVGQHTRKVGQYENVWSKLKSTMIGFFAIGGTSAIVRTLFGTEVRLQGMRTALKNVTQDQQDFAQSLKFIHDLAINYGQDLVVLTDTYKNFRASAKASGLAISEQNKIYESVIKSGSALQMTNEQVEGSLLAISQMFSKGKVSAEELRGQLGERLPGAFGLMAKAMNVTESELNKMLENGEVLAKDTLPLLAKELEKTYGDKAQQNLKTVGGAWNILKTRLADYVSEVNKGGRVTEGLAKALGFIANNLGTIIPMIIKFGVAWAGLKLYNLVKDFKGLREGLMGVSTEAGKAESSSKKFGSAISNIATAYLIAQFASMAFELYEIASGAEEARRAMENMQKAQSNGQKFANDDINRFKRTRELRLKEIELLQSQGKISEKIAKERIKRENDEYKRSIEATKRLTENQLERDKAKLEQAEKYLNKLEKTTSVKDALFFGAFQKQEKKVNDIKSRIAGYRAELKEYNIVLNEQVFVEKDLQIEINNSNKSRRENSKAIKEQKKDLKEYNDELSESLNKLSEAEQQRGLELAVESVNDAMEQQRKNADETGTFNLQMIYDQIDAETKLREAIIERTYQQEIANSKNQADTDLAELNKKIALENLEQEQMLKKKDVLIDLNDAQEEYNNKRVESDLEAQKKLEEQEKAHQERMADFRKKMIESGLDAWKEASQEREKLIDREIDASQKLADQLGEQAKNGTIQANQSLAEQNRITNERLQAKQKEQRIQQQIEEIKLLYSATEQYLADGDTLPVAGAKAFLQVKGIKALAQSLVGFFTGTEGTVGEELGAPQLSGKDGHIVRVDGSEMVMNGMLVNKARSIDPNVTTSEIVNGFIKSKTSSIAPIYVSNSTQDSVLVSEIRDLKKVIERKPEIQMDASRIADNLFEFTTTTKRGADLIRNRHIYRKQ